MKKIKKGDKHMTPTQKLFMNQVIKHMTKEGIDKREAKLATAHFMDHMMKDGKPFDLSNTKRVAKWLIRKKKETDEGKLVKQEDGTVLDTETNEVYDPESKTLTKSK